MLLVKQLTEISGIPLLRNFGCESGFHYLIIDLLFGNTDRVFNT